MIVASLVLSGYICLAGFVYCPAAPGAESRGVVPPVSTPTPTSGVPYVLLLITAHSINKQINYNTIERGRGPDLR